MFADILRHLGRILQKMMEPVDTPMHCPRCHRENGLLLTYSAPNSQPAGWKCQFCNHVVAS